MRDAPTALKDLLATDNTLYFADLYTITLIDGNILRYTSYDQDLTVVGTGTYLSGPPYLERNEIKWTTGLDDSTLELTIKTLNTGGNYYKIFEALINGVFDDAHVTVDRAIMQFPGDTGPGVVRLFTGNVGDILEVSRTQAKLQLNSKIHKLNTVISRNVYQPHCRWNLYGPGCGVSKADYTFYDTIQANSNKTQIVSSFTTISDDYFDQGHIVFTSGDNIGLSRSIKIFKYIASFNAYVFVLYKALPYTPLYGQTYYAIPGCDKLLYTCDNKYNNKQNFGGQPFIPLPETAI